MIWKAHLEHIRAKRQQEVISNEEEQEDSLAKDEFGNYIKF